MTDLSELSQYLPDTVPVGDCIIEKIIVNNNNSWGKLISTQEKSMKDLINDCYEIGRAPSCDFVLTLENTGLHFCNISKIHFKLYRTSMDEQNLVYLEDMSSNGTFVNGIRVGKNNKILLSSQDEISLVTPGNKVYSFLCKSLESNERWLPAKLIDDYLVLKHLGKGAFAEVKLVINKKTCEEYALKKLSNDIGDKRIFNEINILKKLDHPCVIKFHDVIETPEYVCLLLEYIPNGNLHRKITKEKKICEMEAKIIFYQLILAVEYLHNNEIIHRDLKPENILLSKTINSPPYSGPLIKVTDLGLSKILTSKTNMQTACGTLMYAAPEVAFAQRFGPYDEKVDIWSLGIILFTCLTGVCPYKEEDLRKPYMQGKWHKRYKIKHYYTLPPKVRDLFNKMTKIDSRYRIDLSSIFQHPWLKESRDMIEKINKFIGVRKCIKRDDNEDLELIIDSWKKPRLK